MTPDREHAPPLSVVVADDSDAFRYLLRRIVEMSGHHRVVAEAADGVEAVEAAERHQPDILLLDLRMPRMDGFEALPRIRASSPRTMVVVVSGLPPEEAKQRAQDLGASGYIEKGLPPPEFHERLHALGLGRLQA